MDGSTATPTLTGDVTSDQLRLIVDHARRAPSVHNTQPWSWQASGTTLELWTDWQRSLPVSDPLGRNLMISCGAAVHYAVVAARALGAAPAVTYLPDGPDSDLVARIGLTPAQPPAADAPRQLELLAARHTDRRRFTSWPVPEATLEHLAEAGRPWGAQVLPVVEHGLRVQVEDLLEDARRRQIADPRIAQETERWIDHGDTDGVPDAVLPRFEGSRGERPTRFGSGLTPNDVETVVRGTDGLLVISTADDGPLAWLHAGGALNSLWLRATQNGLSIVPLSQVIEVSHTRMELERLLPPPERVPQILVRVGWQEIGRPRLPRTPRRPLGEVLR